MNRGRQPRDRSALLAAMHGLVIRTRHAARLVRQERLAVCLRFASALGCPHSRAAPVPVRAKGIGNCTKSRSKQPTTRGSRWRRHRPPLLTPLLQRGIDVHFYEQAAALAEVGAGVAIQPNGVRKLRRPGLGEGLIRSGARWIDAQFRRADGSYDAAMWPPELASQIEFYGMHRADFAGNVRRPGTCRYCEGWPQVQQLIGGRSIPSPRS